jgi:3-oxoacyl-(acyl-carrier-protein) synthase
MSERVFITGFGLITAIGNNAEENLYSLQNKKHGYGPIETFETVHKNSIRACEIKLTDQQLGDRSGADLRKGFTRTALLGLIAVQEAIESAGLSPTELKQVGFISSTTAGGIREYENSFKSVQDLSQNITLETHVDTANPGEHTERIADFIGIKKYTGTVSTACSSSINTIIQGARLIKNHKLNRVICGGTEALSKFAINGFNSLLILDREHCRPFDATRRGLNLGEAAAYVVIESESAVKKSGKKILGEVAGYGNANDAFHQTASSPDGTGAFLAMSKSLETAGLTPSQIDYINVHGTATENNDLSEGLAIQRLFNNAVPAFSSTKPFTGHTLAAAGSVEVVFSLLSMQNRMIFPNLNFKQQMPELTITPVVDFKKVDMKYVLSNSFGFGGNTSSIVLGAV